MAITITIGGAAVNVPRTILLGRIIPVIRGGIPSASFMVRGRALPTLPDPYLAQEVVIAESGTTIFTGDVLSVTPAYEWPGIGWVRTYQAVGLEYPGDKGPPHRRDVPHRHQLI